LLVNKFCGRKDFNTFFKEAKPMKYLICILLLCGCVTAVKAQMDKVEYGHPSEMKGLTKLFIDTQADIKTSDRLLKEIKNNKDLRAIVIVTDAKKAEMVMFFSASTERQEVPPSVFAPNGGITLNQGTGIIAIQGRDSEKARILMRYSNSQESDWEQKPTTKFIKEFAKAYKTANEQRDN
jgi:hypothetical protein